MKKKLRYLFYLLVLGGLITGRIWCSTDYAQPQQTIEDDKDQEFLHIVSFPQEEVPIKQWLRENGWEVQRGRADTFVVKEKILFMQNTDASTAIGVKFKKKIDARKYPEIEFRARVDDIPPASNVTVRSIDDAAFRLFVLFDKGGWALSPP